MSHIDTRLGARIEEPLFAADLYPHRSLSARGFVFLMAALGGVSFVAGVVFAYVGAWPVFGFFGLDVLIIYFAFRANYRDADISERIELWRNRLSVTRWERGEHKLSSRFEPYWVQIRRERWGRRSPRLLVGSHGNFVSVGEFLTPDERRHLAACLEHGLKQARHKN